MFEGKQVSAVLFLFERICLAIYPRLPGEFHSML